MGFLDFIGKGLSQIGKTINEKIAQFEKTTGIDIPLVGVTKEEISKSQTAQTPSHQQTTSQTETTKTYRVELGTQVHPKQIEEVKKQVGGGNVVVTPEGKVAVEFTSVNPPKEIKVTPYEEIVRQEEEKRLMQQAEQIYEKASPLEKLGMHAHVFFSGKGLEYIWSYLPGGKKPEDIVKEKIVEAMKTPQQEYVLKSTIGALTGSVPGVIGTSALVGMGTGAVVGKVAPAIASKVPVVAKIGETVAKHPTLTKAVGVATVGAIETGKGVMTYKSLEAQGVPKEEIIEKIGADVSRDVLAIAGFSYGLKYGMEKTLPKQQLEVLGRRTEEKTVKLVAGKEEGIPEGKIAQIVYKKEKFVEVQPAKEWLEAIKKGKVVKETPEFIVKEHRGYEYLISKKPTGLPTQRIGEKDIINVLRAEKSGYIKVGMAGEGKYKGMEVFVRKGSGIPVEFEKPGIEEFKPTVFRPSGKPRPVLKELAESYKASKLAEDMKLAEKIAGTKSQQMRAIEEATKNMLGAKTQVTKGAEITSEGLKLIAETKPAGFVPLEQAVSPVVLGVSVQQTVPIITPASVLPGILPIPPRTQVVTTVKEVIKPELKIKQEVKSKEEEIPKPIIIEEPQQIQKTTPVQPVVPVQPVIKKEEESKIITVLKEELKAIEEPKILALKQVVSKPSTPPPILFPELPKGGVSKILRDERKLFKQATKYEPSLLGVLLGKKRGKKQEFFTGFEIRGI